MPVLVVEELLLVFIVIEDEEFFVFIVIDGGRILLVLLLNRLVVVDSDIDDDCVNLIVVVVDNNDILVMTVDVDNAVRLVVTNNAARFAAPIVGAIIIFIASFLYMIVSTFSSVILFSREPDRIELDFEIL
jgi:hypothetical protein